MEKRSILSTRKPKPVIPKEEVLEEPPSEEQIFDINPNLKKGKHVKATRKDESEVIPDNVSVPPGSEVRRKKDTGVKSVEPEQDETDILKLKKAEEKRQKNLERLEKARQARAEKREMQKMKLRELELQAEKYKNERDEALQMKVKNKGKKKKKVIIEESESESDSEEEEVIVRKVRKSKKPIHPRTEKVVKEPIQRQPLPDHDSIKKYKELSIKYEEQNKKLQYYEKMKNAQKQAQERAMNLLSKGARKNRSTIRTEQIRQDLYNRYKNSWNM